VVTATVFLKDPLLGKNDNHFPWEKTGRQP